MRRNTINLNVALLHGKISSLDVYEYDDSGNFADYAVQQRSVNRAIHLSARLPVDAPRPSRPHACLHACPSACLPACVCMCIYIYIYTYIIYIERER